MDLLFYCHTCRHLLRSSPHFVFQFAAGVSLRTSRYDHDSSVWQTEAVLQHKQTNFTLFHLIYGTLFSQCTLYRVWLVSGCMMITWDVCSFSPTSSKMCVTPFLLLNNEMCVRLSWTALWPPSASGAPQLLLITDAVCLWFCPRHSESLLVRLISACLHWRDLINTITDGGSQRGPTDHNHNIKPTQSISHQRQQIRYRTAFNYKANINWHIK